MILRRRRASLCLPHSLLSLLGLTRPLDVGYFQAQPARSDWRRARHILSFLLLCMSNQQRAYTKSLNPRKPCTALVLRPLSRRRGGRASLGAASREPQTARVHSSSACMSGDSGGREGVPDSSQAGWGRNKLLVRADGDRRELSVPPTLPSQRENGRQRQLASPTPPPT
jgi:hypothetical protein